MLVICATLVIGSVTVTTGVAVAGGAIINCAVIGRIGVTGTVAVIVGMEVGLADRVGVVVVTCAETLSKGAAATDSSVLATRLLAVFAVISSAPIVAPVAAKIGWVGRTVRMTTTNEIIIRCIWLSLHSS